MFRKLLSITVFTLFLSATTATAEAPISTGFFSNDAVSGYDTVAYFTEGKARKGSSDYTTQYKGATWKFSSAENLDLFKKNPEKYAPQYGGYCAWAIAQGEFASSDPKQWHIENGKLYLNYNKSIKNKWLENHEEFILNADKTFPSLIK